MAGMKTRCRNGWSSSERIALGAVWIACTAARERPTACRSEVMTPMVASSSSTPRKIPPSPIRSIIWSLMSDLHPDHLAQPEGADREIHQEEHHQEHAGRVGPQLRDVLVAHQQEIDEEGGGPAAEDPRGETAFGRQRTHLAPQPLTFTQRGS